jgi:hypothetical protein
MKKIKILEKTGKGKLKGKLKLTGNIYKRKKGPSRVIIGRSRAPPVSVS